MDALEKKVFIICPVGKVIKEDKKFLDEYVADLESKGMKVYYPHRDTKQKDCIGLSICLQNKKGIKDSDEIHLYYAESVGRLFDSGMFFIAEKPVMLINREKVKKTPYKSFENVLLALDSRYRRKVYFGHPINTYNTQKESELIECIKKRFLYHAIENPNYLHHQKAYQKYEKERGNGMLYYFEEVLPQVAIGAFLPFEDGMWGAGIFKEAEFLHERKKPIYEIDWRGEIKNIELDCSKVLSIEETRKRIYEK